ncbi:hypothetical protein ACOSQ4_030463 [Xanthoceras sorbifolium]
MWQDVKSLSLGNVGELSVVTRCGVFVSLLVTGNNSSVNKAIAIAISFPSGRTRIYAETEPTDIAFWRFTKARRQQDSIPRTRVRKVKAGCEGSSVIGTVSLTSSIGLSLTSLSPA